jgi:hypothetical protein
MKKILLTCLTVVFGMFFVVGITTVVAANMGTGNHAQTLVTLDNAAENGIALNQMPAVMTLPTVTESQAVLANGITDQSQICIAASTTAKLLTTEETAMAQQTALTKSEGTAIATLIVAMPAEIPVLAVTGAPAEVAS